jgi:hypothetical protein
VVDSDLPTVEALAITGVDCLVGGLLMSEGDDGLGTEQPLSVFLINSVEDLNIDYGAELPEDLIELALGVGEAEVPHEDEMASLCLAALGGNCVAVLFLCLELIHFSLLIIY